ncbi:DUF4430 domain-containing protein [Rhodopirellula sp. JC740]|uniref:DUF4430 domain-containing protein n=1 Tax=Rhodopirellula halodulae TaxID=2894198 RepID=A0ABS8NM92_9BACT|nr:DUF4430 domain-containing protein [Rhodopirellula sp. JC740]MCC9643918.1 DUF4430 domain-containing protein [Rhodopirellula sp. JC740]
MFQKLARTSHVAPGHLFSSVAVALLVSLFGLVGCTGTSSTTTVDPDLTESESTGTVTIEFVLEDGTEKTHAIEDVASGTTLESLMRDLDEPKMEIGGEGTTAFIHSIDGVSTSATQGWTYTIDGEFAKTGVGTTKLDPPTTVRWKFTAFEEAMADQD